MKAVHIGVAVVALLIPSVVHGAGLAHNENFMVLAPDQALAEEVLARAADFRAQIAVQWLGEELPPGVGSTVIHIELSDNEDSALTWPIDCAERKFHKVWLTTTRDRALGTTLAHEITHIVLATQFPDRLPAWIEEGAASMQDNVERMDIRRRIISWYARTGNWPKLETVFRLPAIVEDDKASYAVAASVTEFLLARGDKAKFLKFAVATKKKGCDDALNQYYGIGSVRELQAAWQASAAQAVHESIPIAVRTADPLLQTTNATSR